MNLGKNIKKLGVVFGMAALGWSVSEGPETSIEKNQDDLDQERFANTALATQADSKSRMAKTAIWADSLKGYYKNPVNFPDVTSYEKGQWHISLQFEKTEKSEAGYDIGVGQLVLTAPDGEQNSFTFRSGGFGPYKDQSMIPGLQREDMAPYGYDIGWDRFFVDMPMARFYVGPDGKGEFLRLYSDPDKTDRGLTWEQRNGKGAFALHTDGAEPGSHGCVVFSHQDSEKLFEILQAIPKDKRPAQLNIMPSAEVLKRNTLLEPLLSRPIIKRYSPNQS